MDTDGNGINPLSNRIIGCALTVLQTLGAASLEKSTETPCSTSYARLDSTSRNNIPRSYITMGS
jgi:hypothetical protein